MAEKMQPCCARLHGTVQREKAELGRLARMAARRGNTDRYAAKIQAQIVQKKADIKRVEEQLVEHEATHCADVPCLKKAHYEVMA